MIELSGVNLQAAKQHKVKDDVPEALLHSVPPPTVQDEPKEERADLADTEEAGGGGLAGDVRDEGEVPEVEELRVPQRSGDALPIGECHAAPGSLVRKLLRWEVKKNGRPGPKTGHAVYEGHEDEYVGLQEGERNCPERWAEPAMSLNSDACMR